MDYFCEIRGARVYGRGRRLRYEEPVEWKFQRMLSISLMFVAANGIMSCKLYTTFSKNTIYYILAVTRADTIK